MRRRHTAAFSRDAAIERHRVWNHLQCVEGRVRFRLWRLGGVGRGERREVRAGIRQAAQTGRDRHPDQEQAPRPNSAREQLEHHDGLPEIVCQPALTCPARRTMRLAGCGNGTSREPCPRLRSELAPEAGFEPATRRLTVACSTAELLRNGFRRGRRYSACEGAIFWQSVPSQARGTTPHHRLIPMLRGGLGRNRTGIDGFAVRYIATLPPGRPQKRRCYTHGPGDGSSRAATRRPLTLSAGAAYKRHNILGSD